MDLLLRILAWLAAGLGAVVLLVLGSIGLDDLLDGNRVASVTNTQINAQVRAFVAKPQGDGPFPTVIMLHEFYGLTASITQKAQLLSQEGYVVIAPDVYRGAQTNWLPRAILLSSTTPVERVNQDLDAVYTWLSQQPFVDSGRIAAMGFCFGGTAALNFALTNNRLAAIGVFYGQLVSDPQTLKRLSGPVLGIFGEADNLVPLDEVKAFEAGLKAAGVPHEITVYPGQGHAFVGGVDQIKAGGAAGAAWQQFKDFLERRLKQMASAQTAPTPNHQTPLKPANFNQGQPLEVLLGHWHH